MSSLGVMRLESATTAELCQRSRTALDRPLEHDAELVLAEPSDEAIVLGALQRSSELGSNDAMAGTKLLRRGSSGAEARACPGMLWLQLSLARANALVPCEPSRMLNRYVRPILRALAKVGVPTHYFDRDWLSAAKAPVGLVAFGHDASTGRALVEAIVGLSASFAVRSRASFMSKEPTTLAAAGLAVDMRAVIDAVIEGYATAYGRQIVTMDARDPRFAVGAAKRTANAPSDAPAGGAAPEARAAAGDRAGAAVDAPPETTPAAGDIEHDDPRFDPPWAATRDEAIGLVAAGRDRDGRLRIGGELMVSRDAIARLEDRVSGFGADATATDVGRAVDESLARPGVALLGVRSLLSIRDVVLDALSVSSMEE